MTNQPHHDDDQAKKPTDADQPAPSPPSVPPQAGGGDKGPALPNMELDAPEELIFVDEVVEEPVPVVEAVEDEPIVLAEEEVLAAEVVPASDVVLADVVEEVHEAPPEIVSASDVVLADEVVTPQASDSPPLASQPATGMRSSAPDTPVPSVASDAGRPSDVDLMKMFEEPVAAEPSPLAPLPEGEGKEMPEPNLFIDEPTPSEPVASEETSPPSAPEPDLFIDEPTPTEASAPAASEDVIDTAPEPEVVAAGDIQPASEVIAAEDDVIVTSGSAVIAEKVVAEIKPESELVAAEDDVVVTSGSAVVAEEAVAEIKPESDVVAGEDIAPGSAVIAADEIVEEAKPESEVIAAEEVVEEIKPASEVVLVEEIVEEIAPGSAVIAAEDVVEEAKPESEVLAAEEVIAGEDSVEEALPASDIVAAEEVLGEDELAELAPGSAPKSAELFVEEAAEASSATRKAENVLAEEVLDADEAEVVATGSSAVLFDEIIEEETGAKKSGSADYQAASSGKKKTIPFESAGSGAKKGEEDLLVTEEELMGSSEASAIDLGDMPARKGSSVTGIDKVAEALESGVDLEAEEAEPVKKDGSSVEFDDLLDDLGDSAEAELTKPKPKKSKAIDAEGSTEMDAELLESAEVADEPVASKTKAKTPKPGDDDIDLESLFEEGKPETAQPAEALDVQADIDATLAYDATAEGDALEFDEPIEGGKKKKKISSAELAEPAAEALDAEAADIFAEETEASPALASGEIDFDEKPKKGKVKKKPVMEEPEEAMEVAEDVEEEPVSRKRGKRDTVPAPVPEPRRGGGIGAWIGGMFLAFLLLGGALAAGWYFAPDEIVKFVKDTSPTATAEKKIERTPADKARGFMNQGQYKQAVTALDAADTPLDVALRGEARWLDYAQQQADKKAPMDKDAPEVKQALGELRKGKNTLLINQIDAAVNFAAKDKEAKEMADKLTAANAAMKTTEMDLKKATADKEAVEKTNDAVADVLAKGKLIEDKSKLDVAALEKSLKSLSDDKTTLDMVNKLLKGAEVKDAGDKGVKTVLETKKDAEDKLTAVNKVLEEEKIKDQGAKGVLAIVDARNKTMKDRDDLLATVGQAFKEFIDAKIVPADADPRKELVEGAKKARARGDSPLAIPLKELGTQLGAIGTGTGKLVEKSFDAAKLVTELGFYKAREPFIQTPQQKMDTYIALLHDRSLNDAKELGAMRREADWVLTPESKSAAAAVAKAHFVRGLAARNLQKYDEARKEFDDALKSASPVTDDVKRAKLELTDPDAYYLPRIHVHTDEGNYKAALVDANTALKVMPAEPRLHAVRGWIRVELIHGQGAKTPADAQKAIRADAGEAGKDAKLAAESAYLIGRLEEELGNFGEAEKLYRQAIKTNQGGPDEVGKYRVALARLLLRDRPEGAAPAPAPAPADDKKGEKAGAAVNKPVEQTIVTILPSPPVRRGRGVGGEGAEPPAAQPLTPSPSPLSTGERGGRFPIVMHPISLLVVSAIIAQPGDDETEDPAVAARLKETVDLANELIASKNDKIKGQGYMILGSALSKQGKRTQGLKEYAKGLKLTYPGIAADELAKLIDEHPAFQQPDFAGNDPIVAERHFGEGLHLYWSKKYPEAEAQFNTSLKYFDKDARFYYFLGLARYNQKTKAKRDAAFYAWEQGARLEVKAATNPFAVREINFALERVQGPQREVLNSYRYKAVEESEAK